MVLSAGSPAPLETRLVLSCLMVLSPRSCTPAVPAACTSRPHLKPTQVLTTPPPLAGRGLLQNIAWWPPASPLQVHIQVTAPALPTKSDCLQAAAQLQRLNLQPQAEPLQAHAAPQDVVGSEQQEQQSSAEPAPQEDGSQQQGSWHPLGRVRPHSAGVGVKVCHSLIKGMALHSPGTGVKFCHSFIEGDGPLVVGLCP